MSTYDSTNFSDTTFKEDDATHFTIKFMPFLNSSCLTIIIDEFHTVLRQCYFK